MIHWRASLNARNCKPGADTYPSSLFTDASRGAGDEDDLAGHVWYVRGREPGGTRKDVFVDDGEECSHVGYDGKSEGMGFGLGIAQDT